MPKDTFNLLPQEKRERVLKAAAETFAEHGYAGADVAEIAKRAGISKGSIYTYFDSKEDLYLFVSRDGLERSRQAVYRGIQPEWDIYRQVEHIFRHGTPFVQSHPEYIRLYLNASASGMERIAEQLTLEVEKHTADHLKGLIADGIRQGIVRPDLDVGMTAFVINSLYIVFLISLVSTHFQIRMKEYLSITGALTDGQVEDRLNKIIALVHTLLRP